MSEYLTVTMKPSEDILSFCEYSLKPKQSNKQYIPFHSLCGRNKSVEMPIVLIQDFSGARLSGRLQPNNNALWWTEANKHKT